ncbi:MAG: hypothetical protein QOD99_2660, partial [Chthoniobacter sp.]|nr:hypothetical protein [Chthoniobacter sp.]
MISPALARSGKAVLHLVLVFLSARETFSHEIGGAHDDPAIVPPTTIVSDSNRTPSAGINRG